MWRRANREMLSSLRIPSSPVRFPSVATSQRIESTRGTLSTITRPLTRTGRQLHRRPAERLE